MVLGRKLLALLAPVAALALGGCASAEVPTPTPTATPTPTPFITAEQVLERAMAAVDRLNSFHFVVEVKNGSFPLLEGINGVRAEGDALRPDRWRAFFQTDVRTPYAVEMRGIGQSVHITSPRTGSWVPYSTSASLAAFFDPDRGAKALFKGIVRPVKLADSQAGGRPAYHIRGRVDAERVGFITGVVEPGAVVGIEMWIGKEDYYLLRMVLTGRIAPSDLPDMVRILHFSRFNEEVSIEEPEVGSGAS